MTGFILPGMLLGWFFLVRTLLRGNEVRRALGALQSRPAAPNGALARRLAGAAGIFLLVSGALYPLWRTWALLPGAALAWPVTGALAERAERERRRRLAQEFLDLLVPLGITLGLGANPVEALKAVAELTPSGSELRGEMQRHLIAPLESERDFPGAILRFGRRLNHPVVTLALERLRLGSDLRLGEGDLRELPRLVAEIRQAEARERTRRLPSQLTAVVGLVFLVSLALPGVPFVVATAHSLAFQ